MNSLLVAATAAFLFLAPFSGSAGLRAAMLLIATFAVLASWREKSLQPGPLVPRDVAIAGAAWAVVAIASLAWSASPRYSLSELRAEMLYGCLAFLVFFFASTGEARWRVWWCAITTGTLTVLVGTILQDRLPYEIRLHPIDGGPGAWSTQLVLVAPLLFAFAWPRPWGMERSSAGLAAALALLLFTAWDTENRIVWVAFGAQLAAAVAMWRSMPSMDPARVRVLRALAIGAAATVAIGFTASVVERNERMSRSDAPVATALEHDPRPSIWAVGWTQIKAAPWIGHGFGREILAERFTHGSKNAEALLIRHAHNTFMNVALQLGIVGLAAFAALLLALARHYWRFLRDPALAPLGIIGLTLLAGFLAKNLTDDFLHRHTGLVFWAMNGMLLGLGMRARAPA